ncbi:MAG TPA: VWA domain-containing protein [Pyrinomonadaceae bacterium]|nr:VWA domain-containing protein [Pyrinomonadaceae bacterium]
MFEIRTDMKKILVALLSALVISAGVKGKASASDVALLFDREQSGHSASSAEALASDYVLAIDCSGSMRRQLDQIIGLAKSIISRNSRDDQTMILRFIGSPQVVEDFTSDRGLLEEALDSLYIEGGQTTVYDALEVAAQHLKQFNESVAGRKKAIVLITDGEDRGSHRTQDEIVNLLKQANLRVFVIGVQGDLASSRQRAKSFIERVASETGGKAYFPKTSNDFQKAAEEIAQQIHQ